MRRFSLPVWSLVGLVCGGAGCILGSLLGSFLPQVVIASTAVGASMGLLAKCPRTAVFSGLAAGATAALAFLVAGPVVTALAAWPAAALAVGIAATFLLSRRRAKVATVLVSPILGIAGFLCGAAVLIAPGLVLNEGRLVGEFMVAGSAGFGLFTLGGIRMLSGRPDRFPKRVGQLDTTDPERSNTAVVGGTL